MKSLVPMILAVAAGALFPGATTGREASSSSQSPPAAITDAVVSRGSVTLADGSARAFTAYAGTILVGGTDTTDAVLAASEGRPRFASAPASDDPNGPAVARMSYVAYLASNADAHRRPLMFLYDGGPGASSRGLLVASFGPIRVPLPGPGASGPGDAAVGDNPDTLLDSADLVFIDAPGTGFGSISGRNASAAFYGIDGDADAFRRFIERFVVRFDRWGSPIYLFGHSYGTVRNAVLAHLLAGDDRPPRGVVSVSQWLSDDDDLDTGPADPGTDNPYIDALPSYAAIAAYHHRVASPPGPPTAWLPNVETFALHDYAAALLAGSALPPAQLQAIAHRLETLTGIPAATWIATDLRLDGDDFRRLVLAEPGRITGRLDARYTGTQSGPLAPPEHGADPFGDAVGPTIAVANDRYQHEVLHVPAADTYIADADIPDLRWNNYHSTTGHPWQSFFNVMPDLTRFLLDSPSSRVLVMNGFYDLGTTYLAAEQELRHLRIPADMRSRIELELYPTGHEPYIADDIRHAMHDRIAGFIARSR